MSRPDGAVENLMVRFTLPPGMGVYTTKSINPEGVVLVSRGREPADTGPVSSLDPKGVTFALPMGIDHGTVA